MRLFFSPSKTPGAETSPDLTGLGKESSYGRCAMDGKAFFAPNRGRNATTPSVKSARVNGSGLDGSRWCWPSRPTKAWSPLGDVPPRRARASGGPRPLPRAYPQALATLGDHLRKRRLDLGLLQREVAEGLGVTESTVTNWELNRTEPELRFIPAIVRCLGYLPFSHDNSIGKQLTLARTVRGPSRETAARLLAVDPGTLGRWESGQRRPQGAYLARIETFLASLGEVTRSPSHDRSRRRDLRSG